MKAMEYMGRAIGHGNVYISRTIKAKIVALLKEEPVIENTDEGQRFTYQSDKEELSGWVITGQVNGAGTPECPYELTYRGHMRGQSWYGRLWSIDAYISEGNVSVGLAHDEVPWPTQGLE